MQPFDKPERSAEKWSAADEAHRLDHICGVVFEGSIALTGAAALLAFTLKDSSAKTLVFAIAGGCALPGFLAGFLLLWNPLKQCDEANQLTALRGKRSMVHTAVLALLAGVPYVAVAVAGKLYPDAQRRVEHYLRLAGYIGAAAFVVVIVVLFCFLKVRRRGTDAQTQSLTSPRSGPQRDADAS
jgi:Na+/proline symporter